MKLFVTLLVALVLTSACGRVEAPAHVVQAVEGTCSYDGKSYNPGDNFPATDGINSCGCSAGGRVSCTMIAAMH